jgi:pilus assembly protein CpaB
VKRRVLGGVAAILLAAVGAVLLLTYVGAADERAMSGMRSVSVLVVTKPVAEGTLGEQLTSLVTAKELPAIAVTAGAVADLAQLAGQVATTDLKPGEQLLSSRFVDPATLPKAGEVTIPKGLQEVSILLDPQRVVGGRVVAGARVGVFLSLPKDDIEPARTHLTLNKVLVSRVEGGTAPAVAADKKVASTTSANGVMVTLALSAADAEEVVYGAEYGTLWLSLEPADVVLTGTRVVTRENVDE